jgi:Zn-dependent M32 family carboxypeptidase
MEHKKQLEDLNKKSLEKIDEYLKTKDRLPQEHHEKVNDAKNKWQSAWVELMNTLMFLERLEI